MLNRILFCSFFLLWLIIPCHSLSQISENNYYPFRNYSPDQDLLERINAIYDSIGSGQLLNGKDIKKSFKTSIQNSKAKLKSLDSAGYLMQRDTLTKYLQAITDHITQSNNSLREERLTVFSYRSNEPNASNRAAGIILFNLDLLTRLETEEEIAFVLCHEISHDILEHVVQNMIKQTEMNKNPVYKKKLEEIKNQEFNQLSAYETLVAKFLYENSGLRRVQESQADSLGLVLFLNCGYNPLYAMKVISKLDSVDEILFKDPIEYEKHFSFSDYSFKKSWLDASEEEESIGGNLDDSYHMPDSLKTHPDCKKRCEAMRRIIDKSNKPITSKYMREFEPLRKVTQFEMVEFFQQNHYFSKALYYSIELLRIYPENQYLHASVANCLLEISLAQKNHYFSSVVEYPSKTYGESYFRFLTFLHNTNSDVISTLAVKYHKKHNKGGDVFTDYVTTLIEGANANQEHYPKLVNDFKQQHQDPYYASLLETKFKIKPSKK